MFEESERLTLRNQLYLFNFLNERGVPFKLTGNLGAAWYGFNQHLPEIEILVPRSIKTTKAVFELSEDTRAMFSSFKGFYQWTKYARSLTVSTGSFAIKFVMNHMEQTYYDYKSVTVEESGVEFELLEKKELIRYLKYVDGMKTARAYLALTLRMSDKDRYYLERYF
jgi:hypothetical protein